MSRQTPILFLGGFAALSLSASSQTAWPAFVAVSLVLTAALWRLSRNVRLGTGDVLLFALAFRLLLFPLLPTLSDDAFRYVWDGMLTWDGINPFRYIPADEALANFRASPLYARLNSAEYFSVYPPVSQLVFLGGGWAPGWTLSFLLIKAATVSIEIGGMVLLSRIVPPNRLVLYAWNPLVIVETAGQAHTEALLAFFLVATVFAAERRRPATSIVSLTAAIWTKLYPIALLPFLLRRVGLRYALVAAFVTVATVLPFWDPQILPRVWSSLRLYVEHFEFYSGPYLLLKWIGYEWLNLRGFEGLLGSAMALIFLLFVVSVFWKDRADAPIATPLLAVVGGFLVASTTVHPWYFVGLLALLPLAPRHAIAWIWLSAFSTATYLLYSHDLYWPFVWVGWGGWLILLVRSTWSSWSLPRAAIDRVLKRRARTKADRVRPFLHSQTAELDRPLSVLDLGAGEGWVGASLGSRSDYRVTLCDVRDSNRTDLDFVRYDGFELPFGDKWFDATILIFTLHHCEDHVAVVHEAGRVTRKKVVVIESVFRSEAGRRVLSFVDRAANAVRSGGEMSHETHFRKLDDWVDLLEHMGFEIESVRSWGRLHKQGLIVAVPPTGDSPAA